jgi:hypothetical protein
MAMDVQRGYEHAATWSMEMELYMQHGLGHGPLTGHGMNMLLGMDMGNGHGHGCAAWTWSRIREIDMQHKY